MHRDAYCICKLHVNRPVRIHTRHGLVYEGTIVHVDPDYVHLRVSGGMGAQGTRQFYPGYYYNPSEQILTLALFDLLAITLLLT